MAHNSTIETSTATEISAAIGTSIEVGISAAIATSMGESVEDLVEATVALRAAWWGTLKVEWVVDLTAEA